MRCTYKLGLRNSKSLTLTGKYFNAFQPNCFISITLLHFLYFKYSMSKVFVYSSINIHVNPTKVSFISTYIKNDSSYTQMKALIRNRINIKHQVNCIFITSINRIGLIFLQEDQTGRLLVRKKIIELSLAWISLLSIYYLFTIFYFYFYYLLSI